MTSFTRRSLLGAATLTPLAACSSADPLGGTGDGTTLTIGSAGFAESEIIAELYAQVLEGSGYQVKRRMRIGSREVFFAALQDGSIDLIPDYSGNLLQFLDPETTATTEEVESALTQALPNDMRLLNPAPAENRDSWCVTDNWATDQDIKSLADLGKFEGKLRIGGNPELQERPYGPSGLEKFYGFPKARINFIPIDDGGGPLTVQALLDGEVDMADIYTTTPAIVEENLVVLADPKSMIMPQHVVGVLSDRVPTAADELLNAVQAKLTTEDLISMNTASQGDEKLSADIIASGWLRGVDLLG